MEYILVMTFICSNGDKVSMSLSGVKGTITGAQVKTLMDTIIAKNIFDTKNGDLIGRKNAFLTEKVVRELNVSV